MQIMERLKGEVRMIREKIGGYPLPDQIAFIWQYYWVPITIVLVLLSVLGFVGYRYATVPGESWFHACFSNTFADLGDDSAFYRGFAQYAGYDLSKKTMTFNASNYCDPTRDTYGDTYYQTLVAMLDSGTLDVVVMEEEKLGAIGAAGRLMDLSNDELMGGFAERWQDRFVYCQPYNEAYSTDPVPVGIDLSGTFLVGEYRAYAESAVLGINAQAPHLDQCEVFLNYIFELSRAEEADE